MAAATGSSGVAPAATSGSVPEGDCTTQPNLETLEQLVNECSPSSTQAAAQILREYSANKQAAVDWDSFVQHNWLPILSLALGPEWRSKYDSEVAAMIALQLSVQPPPATAGGPAAAATATPPAAPSAAAASGAGSSAAASTGLGASSGAAGLHGFVGGAPTASQLPPAPESAGAAMGQATGESGSYGVEAQEIDGKRRRLRRKRAASPDSPYLDDGGEPPSAPGAEAATAAAAPTAAVPTLEVQPHEPLHVPLEAAGASDRTRTNTASRDVQEQQGGSSAGVAQATPRAGLGGPAVRAGRDQKKAPQGPSVQRVTRQVAKLSLAEDGSKGGAGDGVLGSQTPPRQPGSKLSGGDSAGPDKPDLPAAKELPADGRNSSGSARGSQAMGDGAAGAAASPSVAGDSKPQQGTGGKAGSSVGGTGKDGNVGDGGGVSCHGEPPKLQRGLLDSLALVHDLSARIVTNLQALARARGLNLPAQVAAAGGGAGRGGALPLRMLLGGSLVDRMDLLGRTAMHVAAATGRADVVRQLAAAGAGVNKPLPMDYRTLLKQHPEMEAEQRRQEQRQEATSQAEAGGGEPETDGGEPETDGGEPAQEEAQDAVLEIERKFLEHMRKTGLLGLRLEDEDVEEQQSKRGRYCTGATVPCMHCPSLQYCTPLHLASLHGHLEVVDALLAPAGGAATPADANARSLEGATALHLAAFAGHANVVARLCRAPGVLPDVPDHQGRTPLHVAAARGHDSVVVEMWARGAAIDPADAHGWTPLHHAARGGFVEVAAKLVIAGSHVQSCDPGGVTAAHLAAERGHAGIVERLLMAGYVADSMAGPLGDDTEGGAALHLAAANGHAHVVRCLLRSNAGAKVLDFAGRSALDLAVINGHFPLCGDLLDAGCWFSAGADPGEEPAPGGDRAGGSQGKVGSSTEEELAAGAQKAGGSGEGKRSPPQPPPPAGGGLGPVGLLRLLSDPAPHLQPGFEQVVGTEVVAPTMRLTFVECAARAGQLEAVQALVRRGGVDLRSGGDRPSGASGSARSTISSASGCGLGVAVLGAAVLSQRSELVEWLLSDEGGGCSLEAALQQHDLLHEAASRGHVPCMAALLAAASKAGGGGGGGSLSAAVAEGSSGADGTTAGDAAPEPLAARLDLGGQRRTPLHAAVLHNQQEMALFLIEQLAASQPSALAAPDANGWTPLHHAAYRGLMGVVATLLEHPSVSPDLTTDDGQMPLHLSAKSGHVGATYALLESRASASCLDSAGHLPIHYVALRGDLAFFNLLFAMSAGSLGTQAGALLLSCAIKGGSSEMVGILLLTGVTSPAKCTQARQAPVHAAAKEGYLDVLQYLFGVGYDLTAADCEGKTPLHYAPIGFGQAQLAAKRGVDHHAVAEVLLAAGCTADAPDSHGCTPVHFAAGAGALGMLGRFLALAPQAVDMSDTIGWTPLFWACNNGHALAVERLLAEGANPWAKDCNQRLPLHFAAEAGHLACVRSLIPWMRRQAPRPAAAAAGAGAAPQAADAAGGGSSGSTSSGGKKEVAGPLDIPDQNGQTPVQLAAEHGHPDCAALLLDDAEGTGEGKRCTALHLAAAQGRASVVQQLLAPSHRRLVQPSAKDADGWAALHHAAARGHKEVVQALLAAQVELDDVAADGDTALHKAALGGFLGIAVLLAGARCQLDQRNTTGATALYNAASQGHVLVVRHLAAEGANLDAATTNGCTPLYIAANNGFVDAVTALLELGADPDLETTSGCTALHAAALNGHAAVVSQLVEHGCDIDAQSKNGSSALHNAASGGHVTVVDVLVGACADADVQNGNGNTPLHLAAGKGWADLVDRLLSAGADVHIRNAKGWSAIQSAANSGWFEIVLRMVQHGATWRLKGDADVVKLLCKKSSYKASYIEGRLRIAEKERQRRLARAAEEVLAGECAPSKEEQAARAAAADAVMAALLEEEAAAKEKAERQKAKKAAKKQKKAAEQQAQQDAVQAQEEAAAAAQPQENEEREEEEGEAEAAAPASKGTASARPGSSEATSQSEGEGDVLPDGGAEMLAASTLTGRPSSRANTASREGKQAALHSAPAVAIAVPIVLAKPSRQPCGKAVAAATGVGGHVPATPKTPSKRHLVGAAAESAAASASKHVPTVRVVTAKAVPVPVRRVQSSGGSSAASSPAPKAVPAILPPRSASAASVLRPAAAAARLPAPAAGGARAGGPYAAVVAGQHPGYAPVAAAAAAASAGPLPSRPAPWASAAVSAAGPAGVADPAVQQATVAGIKRPAHLSSATAAEQSAAGAVQHTAPQPAGVVANGASAQARGGRTIGPWATPSAAAAAAAAAASSGLLSAPLAATQQAYALPHSMQAAAAGMVANPRGTTSAALAAQQQTRREPALQHGQVAPPPPPSLPTPAGPGASAPLPVQRPQQAGPSFVPLFGLHLSSIGGLSSSVDWSMPTSSGATAFGSPARPSAPQPPPLALQQIQQQHLLQQQQAFARAAPTAAPAAAPAAAAPANPSVPPPQQQLVEGPPSLQGRTPAGPVSVSSPSDASSIESSEANDLLNGIHSHVSRGLAPTHHVLLVQPCPPGVQQLLPGKAAVTAVAAAAVAAGGDEDGIDDVLRLQPWLGDF